MTLFWQPNIQSLVLTFISDSNVVNLEECEFIENKNVVGSKEIVVFYFMYRCLYENCTSEVAALWILPSSRCQGHCVYYRLIRDLLQRQCYCGDDNPWNGVINVLPKNWFFFFERFALFLDCVLLYRCWMVYKNRGYRWIIEVPIVLLIVVSRAQATTHYHYHYPDQILVAFSGFIFPKLNVDEQES